MFTTSLILSLTYIIVSLLGNHYTTTVNSHINDDVNALIARLNKITNKQSKDFQQASFHIRLFYRAYDRQTLIAKPIKIMNYVAIVALLIYGGILFLPDNLKPQINYIPWIIIYVCILIFTIIYNLVTVLNFKPINENIKQANQIAIKYLYINKQQNKDPQNWRPFIF